MTNATFVCPACGYDRLDQAPWQEDQYASDEICPSCGIHFGFDDVAGGEPSARCVIYERWREEWMSHGCRWFSTGTAPPPGWDPHVQLSRVGQGSAGS